MYFDKPDTQKQVVGDPADTHMQQRPLGSNTYVLLVRKKKFRGGRGGEKSFAMAVAAQEKSIAAVVTAQGNNAIFLLEERGENFGRKKNCNT